MVTVDLYTKDSGLLRDDTLLARKRGTVGASGEWKGLLIPYTLGVALSDDNGRSSGPDGSVSGTSADVYQYLREAWGVSNGESGTVRVP